ncbi:hypothetical protein JXA88_10020 [Candidatus Fermentibacteria bacterium]|nr:hypothetical protein [Candidatus Fermentibacteria bacterium]
MKRPSTQWMVMPLWGVSILLYHAVVPFPPWVADTGAVSVLLLLLSYASGAMLQVCSMLASAHSRLSIVLHGAARAVFLLGGLAVYILHGRPDELASLWALFLISSRLRPPLRVDRIRHPEMHTIGGRGPEEPKDGLGGVIHEP